MKLNNHGWGDKEFIFSIVAILIVLLVVVINVHRLYDALDYTPDASDNTSIKDDTNTKDNTSIKDNTNNNQNNNEQGNNGQSNDEKPEEVVYNEKYYRDYQNQMINATRSYVINSNASIPSDGLKIDLSTLIDKNYIKPLNDMIDNRICDGYSRVLLNGDSSLNIKTYLNCSNYVTEGY